MEEKGWDEARKILEGLGYRVGQMSRTTRTPYPYDLIAEKGGEHLLIEVKYAEDNHESAGFYFRWSRRAYQELKKKAVSEGWKSRVLLIARDGDQVNYLFLEPHFAEPWFKLDV